MDWTRLTQRLGLRRRETPAGPLRGESTLDFFQVDPKYFPTVTRDLLSREEMLRYGALPLGFKTSSSRNRSERFLNVGFLDPTREDFIHEIEQIAKKRLPGEPVRGVRVYLVAFEDYRRVLSEVYGVTEEKLAPWSSLAPIPAATIEPPSETS